MKSTIKQLSLAAILSLAAASAMADMNATSDYYVGGQLGASNSAVVNESGAIYGIFGGREFDRSTGFEVGYNHFPNFGGSAVNGGA